MPICAVQRLQFIAQLLAHDFLLGRNQLVEQRAVQAAARLQRHIVVDLATSAFCADTGNTWPAPATACATLACWRDLGVDVFLAAQLVPHAVDSTSRPAPAPMWLRQTSISLWSRRYRRPG
jgi:hypothetical protein